MEPEKPFACTFSGCNMTFTNEDHLHVHTKKHDMVLQLGMEQKTAFVGKSQQHLLSKHYWKFKLLWYLTFFKIYWTDYMTLSKPTVSH